MHHVCIVCVTAALPTFQWVSSVPPLLCSSSSSSMLFAHFFTAFLHSSGPSNPKSQHLFALSTGFNLRNVFHTWMKYSNFDITNNMYNLSSLSLFLLTVILLIKSRVELLLGALVLCFKIFALVCFITRISFPCSLRTYFYLIISY